MARVRVGRGVSLLVGLLVAGLFGLAYTSYQRDIQHARERVSTGSQIVQTPCGPIEYALAGDGHNQKRRFALPLAAGYSER